MFDIWEGKEGDTFEDGWKNKLIWGDNLLVMGALLLEKFAGKAHLIPHQTRPFCDRGGFLVCDGKLADGDLEVVKDHEEAHPDTW